jgi:hypothetical protein
MGRRDVPPAFIDIQRKLVDALMRMPVMDDFAGRTWSAHPRQSES